MKRAKILFILHMPPPVHGAAIVGQNIHDSKLINSEFDCHYINLTLASDIEDIGKAGLKKLLRILRLLYLVRKKVMNGKPDLVYLTPNAKGSAFFKEWLVMMLLKSMRCKVVVHYHNKGVASNQDNRLYDWLYRQFFDNIKVILLAERLYQDVQKYVKKENMFVCQNGIAVKNDVIRKNVGNHVPRLLFLSNLIKSKGVLVLLDALAILKAKDYSFVCDIVGGESKEIDNKRISEEIRQRGIENVTVYWGRKYENAKEEILDNTDIFVFPTYYDKECFPLVLLEAMQHGLPIITTNEGGIADMVIHGENGLICKKKNPLDLATCLIKLLDNPSLMKSMGKVGYNKYKEYFTIEAFERRFADILHQLTN